jgi:hypothetical protein
LQLPAKRSYYITDKQQQTTNPNPIVCSLRFFAGNGSDSHHHDYETTTISFLLGHATAREFFLFRRFHWLFCGYYGDEDVSDE